MGGFGSGNRRQIGRDTCESYKRIAMSYLRKHGLLEPGYSGSLSWTRGGHSNGDIRFRSYSDCIELNYKYREAGDAECRDVIERINFTYSPQHLGGMRRWFVCPSCGKRCGVLYGGTHFRCRKCLNLAYSSQNESPMYRALSQAQKIRQRLGGSGSLDEAFPDKPKGMHWRTYDCLRERSERLEVQSNALFSTTLRRWARV